MIYLNNLILFVFCDDFGYCSGLCLWCHVSNDGYVYLNWLRSRLSCASDALLDLVQLCKLNFITMLLLLLLLTPSRLLGKWYDCCFIEWLYATLAVIVLRCMTIWSCAQQPVLQRLTCGDIYLYYWPVMLVWGHSHFCEMNFLLIYPGLAIWCLSWPCCVSEVHILFDMCPAQPGYVDAVSFALLSLPMKHKLRLLPWVVSIWLKQYSQWWTWQSNTLQIWGIFYKN
jgi:hypothetical protein